MEDSVRIFLGFTRVVLGSDIRLTLVGADGR